MNAFKAQQRENRPFVSDITQHKMMDKTIDRIVSFDHKFRTMNIL
jgi:hypothetical protein